MTYRFTTQDENRENLANDIIEAADVGADIMVMCFGTSKLVIINGKYWKRMWNYPLVQDAVAYADAMGVVIVAAAGNNPPGDQWDQIPYHAWPAEYPNVIGVSATYPSDNFVDGWNYSPPGTQLIDVAAPGKDIYTTSYNTSNNDTYVYDSGTSVSAPLVAAQASLIIAVDPSLTSQQVQAIITSTADKVGQYSYDANGWNQYLGYGRINAQTAVLKALDGLPSRKSISSLAIAYNGSRKLVKIGSNLYLVYESGNQIYFTKSTDDGNSWTHPPTRLSDGLGLNKYPSITGTSTKQFVVWQRYNTTTGKYDTYFTKNTGSSWTTATTIPRLSGLTSTTDPLPVVTYKAQGGNYRLLVCVSGISGSNTGILYQYSDSPNEGSTWYPSPYYYLPSTNSTHKNPSLSMGPTTPATTITISYDNGSNVYYNTYATTWGTAQNISSGSGTSNNRYASVEVDGNGGKNFAWQGYSPALSCDVIVHRRDDEPFRIFEGDGACRPSITGHSTNKRSIVFYTILNHLYKLHYNGSSWSQTMMAYNSKHPILSAGTTTAKYVWTSGSASPYTVALSSEILPPAGLLKLASSGIEPEKIQEKEIESQLICHRTAVLQDSLCSTLFWVELGEIVLINQKGDAMPISLKDITEGSYKVTQQNVFSYLETSPFVISENVIEVEWQENLYGLGMNRLARSQVSNVVVEFQLIDAVTGTNIGTLTQQNIPNTAAESRVQGVESHNISAYRGKTVKLRTQCWGLEEEIKGIVAGVAEVYLSAETGRRKDHNEPEKSDFADATTTSYYLEQNCPNPFNPETEIKYQILDASHVTLKIYNLLGQQVKTLVDHDVPAGSHTVRWDGKDEHGQNLASGIYIYRLEAGSYVASKKLALVR